MLKIPRCAKTAFLLLLAAAMLLGGCAATGVGRQIASPADLASIRIAVMTATTSDVYCDTYLKDTEVQRFTSISDAVIALEAGKADAALMNVYAARGYAKASPRLAILEEPLFVDDTAVGIGKGKDALNASLSEAITGFKADGTIEEMKARWPESDYDAEPEVEIPVGKGET